MATEPLKTKEQNDDVTKALNEITTRNLSIGVSKFGDENCDFNDAHVDMKSNASANLRRGSVSYSQPSSPVSSVSSLSDLSAENYETADSESCHSSLNSNDSSFYSGILPEFVSKPSNDNEEIIHENKENMDKKAPNNNNNNTKKSGKKKKKKNALTKSMSYDKSFKNKKKTTKRRNSKDCLDITVITRLTNTSIQTWSVHDVVQWIKYIHNGKYKQYAKKFQSKKIDGKKLYKMNRSMLQAIEVYHPSARKDILAALQKLKTKVRQRSKKQMNLYGKEHKHKHKPKRRKHKRCVSNVDGMQSEMYVIATKKENDSVIPAINGHLSAPISTVNVKRKYSQNISEFLHEWDVKPLQHNNINFIGSQILEQTENFTMIKLSNKRIVYAVTAKVEKWTNFDVCKWLNSIAGGTFKKFIPKFKQRKTNGFDLLNISRVQLQNNINMKDIEMRNILLREIKLLKIATKPTHNKLLKKRSSATSVKEIQSAQKQYHKHRHVHHHHKSHKKSASLLSIPRSVSHNDLHMSRVRKLGPRDIGRNKHYKGTKYKRSMFDYDFLEEKINYHAKTQYFNKRKMENPVKHKETVNEIGIVKDFEKPQFCNDILRNMNKGGWLIDRPISRRNAYLDSLKGTKIPRGINISEINKPIGWKPIEYKFKNDGKVFLEEHFWFDGSGVQFEFGFSRLINCLSPNKLLQLNKQASPTGYESKLNWLKMLLNMITEEMELIKKEDVLFENVKKQNMKRDSVEIDFTFENEIKNENEIKTENENDNKSEIETIDIKTNNNNNNNNNNNLSLSESLILSENESENDSDDKNNMSPDMNTKRTMYKAERIKSINRNRANTTLANSTLSGISPMTPRTRNRKRTLSHLDRNRRRFMSQESVDSIQAIITNIQKKRTIENVID